MQVNACIPGFFFGKSLLRPFLRYKPAPLVGTLRWARFLSDEKSGKESPKEGPSPSLWYPPRFSILSGVAFQTGPKGVSHTRRKSHSLFLCGCWGGATFSRFRPYLWRTPADSGRAKAATPRPEALVEGVEAISGVETTQRCAMLSNPPHQAQGRLGPEPGKTNQLWGFQRDLPLVGLWCLSAQSERHPAEPKTRLASYTKNTGEGLAYSAPLCISIYFPPLTARSPCDMLTVLEQLVQFIQLKGR